MSQKPTPNDLRKLADDWNRDRQDDGEILHWAVCQAADEIERLQKDLKGTENARDQYTDWHGVARAEVRAALQAQLAEAITQRDEAIAAAQRMGDVGVEERREFHYMQTQIDCLTAELASRNLATGVNTELMRERDALQAQLADARAEATKQHYELCCEIEQYKAQLASAVKERDVAKAELGRLKSKYNFLPKHVESLDHLFESDES